MLEEEERSKNLGGVEEEGIKWGENQKAIANGATSIQSTGSERPTKEDPKKKTHKIPISGRQGKKFSGRTSPRSAPIGECNNATRKGIHLNLKGWPLLGGEEHEFEEKKISPNDCGTQNNTGHQQKHVHHQERVANWPGSSNEYR